MPLGFAVLLLCQLVGEALARGFSLPVPGPVLGLAFLLIGLAAWQRGRGLEPEALTASGLGRVADGLLASLALLFVPAGVGVVQYLGLIGLHGPAILISLVFSTMLTIAATVGTFVLIKRLWPHADEETRP